MNKFDIKTIVNALKPRPEAVLGDKIEIFLLSSVLRLKKAVFAVSKRCGAPQMPENERIIFIKRLSILIKTGVPIVFALGMVERQTDSAGIRDIINKLRVSVETGKSLATGMEGCGGGFGKFAPNIVRIGEASGTLWQSLSYLADELKKKKELKRNITSALVYPAFIVAATLGIVILLTAYVFPKILPVFSSFKAELPWSTKALIIASRVMQQYWAHGAAVLALIVVLAMLFSKRPAVRYAFDQAALRFPLIGPMFKNYCIANFCRTLGLLLKSGVGIIQALRITGDTAGSVVYRAAFFRLTEGVVCGGAISGNMEKEKFLFPPLVSQMIAVGETSGKLSSSLEYLAEIYEDELNNTTKNLSTSIEPLLMIFMGAMVGFIAMSIITPIYGITQNLHQ